jgi:hypothetical protein
VVVRENPNAGLSRVTVTPAMGLPAASYTVPYTTAFCVAANIGRLHSSTAHARTTNQEFLLITPPEGLHLAMNFYCAWGESFAGR